MAGRRIVTQWQIFVAHARLVDEMRAVRLGDGVERAGFDDGRQIDFGGEGAFRIDRAESLACAATDLTERSSSTGNIATPAQKIVIFTAASYL